MKRLIRMMVASCLTVSMSFTLCFSALAAEPVGERAEAVSENSSEKPSTEPTAEAPVETTGEDPAKTPEKAPEKAPAEESEKKPEETPGADQKGAEEQAPEKGSEKNGEVQKETASEDKADKAQEVPSENQIKTPTEETEEEAAGEAEEGRYKTVSFNGEGEARYSYELDLEDQKAKLLSAKGDGCDIVIPSRITYGEKSYTVDAISDNAVDGGIRSLSVDEDLRTIHGNLFDWNKVTERNVGITGDNYYQYSYIKGDAGFSRESNPGDYIIYDIPDTAETLASIPDFIKNNYVEGAYYSGKCLVRVDPDYSGDFEVKDGTVCILASAFEGCSRIQNVTLPGSVEFIGMRAFANSSVVSVNLPKGLIGHSDNIAAYTFYGCDDLHFVNIDEGVMLSNIGPYAFMDCSNLKEFDFSKVGKKALGIMCFAGAFNNAEISIRSEQLGQYLGLKEKSRNWQTGEYEYEECLYPVPAQFAKAGIKNVRFLDNKETQDEYSVVSTGCFYNCNLLESVTLSPTVKNLWASCFEGCSRLDDDVLAQEGCKVEVLDYRCFARTGFSEITIPQSINLCRGGVFAEDSQLKKLNWKSGYIGFSLFALLNDCSKNGCSSYMTGCTIGTNTDITNSGFKNFLKKPDKDGNTFITELNLYAPVIEALMDKTSNSGYNKDAFSLQPYLETVNIYNSEEDDIAVPNGMFRLSPSLSCVNFEHPEKVTEIREEAFSFCPALKSFQFTEMTELSEIGPAAFQISGSSSLFSAKEVSEFADDDPRKDYGLIELDLSNCEKLQYIDRAAFYLQYNLETVKLPENVTFFTPTNSSSFEDYPGVFVGCASLKTLEAACPAKNLGTASLGQNFYVKSSGNYRNSKGSNETSSVNDVLETIVLTNTGDLPKNFFNHAMALKNVTLKKTDSIPNGEFTNCVSLKTVNLPDTKVIGGNEEYYPVFYGCFDLELNAPEATKIGDYAFAGSEFTKIDLPKVTEFGKFAFCNSDKLTSLSIAEGTTELSWFMCDDCDSLESVSLPSTLKSIGWAAFKNCPKLTSVKIPRSVTFIDDDAFAMTDAEVFGNVSSPYSSRPAPKKVREKELSIALSGNPEIKTSLSSNDMSARNRYLAKNEYSSSYSTEMMDALEALLPIPDGSTAVCKSTQARTTAEKYKEEHAPGLVIKDGVEAIAEDIDTVYSGRAVSDSFIKGTATCKGESITGAWTFKEGQKLTDVSDNGIKTVVFTPDDENLSAEETTLTLTIAPKAVTVKADDKSMIVGEAVPELTATVTGLVEGEDESLIEYTLSREAGDSAGLYTITPSGNAIQGNYSVTFETGTLAIKENDKPACTHINTEIRGVKEETCMTEGYTGDTYCADCGDKIKEGKSIPIDPNKHDFDYSNGKVTKEPTEYTLGETTYYCRHNSEHTITLQNIPLLPSTDGNDYSEFAEDTKSLSGDAAPKVETKKDENGNEVEKKVSIGGEEVSKIVVDPESGKETVESKLWISGLESSYTYKGSAVTPDIRVYDGASRLADSDYSVSIKNNTEVGNAVVTVKFKGNYSGTAEQKTGFEITPAVLGRDIKAHEVGAAANKKVQKPVPVLTWVETGRPVSSKFFEVSYDREVKDAGEYTATITASNKNYTGSTTAKISVVGSSKLLLSKAKVTFNPGSYAYTGSEIVPAAGSYKLKIGSVTVPSDAYEIQDIFDNVKPGKATVIFEAKPGNSAGYVGTKTATFKINGKREIKEAIAKTASDSVPYAKGGAKASVIITDGGYLLKEDRDYTLSYSKNKNLTNGEKTAEVKIKGKGNYKGTIVLNYAIGKQKLDNLADNIVIADQFTAKSKLKKPSLTVTDVDGKLLAAGKDYNIKAVDDSDPLNTESAGKVRVTIAGTENGAYEGECKAEFSYTENTAANISKAALMKGIPDQIYTGRAVKLSNAELTGILYTGSKTDPVYLVPGKDFTVTGYSKNIKTGTAKVKIKGIGEYAGKKTLSFKIVQKKADYKGALVGGGWK